MFKLSEIVSKNRRIAGNDSKVFFIGVIPEKKLHNAINAFGNHIESSDVVVLVDDTVFGSAKDGVILTDNCICGKEAFENPWSFNFSDIESLELIGKKLVINDTPVFKFNLAEKSSLSFIFSELKNCIENKKFDKKEEVIDNKKSSEGDYKNIFAGSSSFYKKGDFFAKKMNGEFSRNYISLMRNVLVLHDQFFDGFYECSQNKIDFILIANSSICIEILAYFSVTANNILKNHVDDEVLNLVSASIFAPVYLVATEKVKNQKPRNVAEAANPNLMIENSEELLHLKGAIDYYAGNVGLFNENDPEIIYRKLGSHVKSIVVTGRMAMNEAEKDMFSSSVSNYSWKFSEDYAKYAKNEIEKYLIECLSRN